MKRTMILFSSVLVLFFLGCFVNKSYAINNYKKAFYTVKIKKSFKSAVFDLQQSIMNDNYIIVGVNPISQGIKNVGKKISKLDIIEFCNLSYAYDILHHNKDYAAFMPCRIAVYKEGKYVVMIGFLPSYALKFFKFNTPLMKKVALKVARQMISIMNSVKSGF